VEDEDESDNVLRNEKLDFDSKSNLLNESLTVWSTDSPIVLFSNCTG
jgi:hypothetical protein